MNTAAPHQNQTGRLSNSKAPLFFLTSVGLWIFVAEVLIMFLFALLPEIPPLAEPFVGGGLLSLLVLPALYRFLYRPLKMENRERQIAEYELRGMGMELYDKAEKLAQTLKDL